jgi:hypothetical protein
MVKSSFSRRRDNGPLAGKVVSLEFQGKFGKMVCLDRAKRDEKELVAAMKELEHLRHLVKYYQDTTQGAVYLRSEFKEAYNKFTDE